MKKTSLKALLAAVLCLAMVFGLCACTVEDGSTTTTDDSSTTDTTTDNSTDTTTEDTSSTENTAAKRLFFMPKCIGYDYWTSCEAGVNEAAEELGYEVTFNGPSTTDSAQQITMIEDAMTQGYSGLAIAPNDAEAIAATIADANARGINTITFDTDAPNSDRAYCVLPDSDYAMGEQLGEMIASEIGGEGQIAFMVASFSAENQVSKVEGATDYLAANYPDIEIVATVNSDDANEKAFENAQTLLATYPDLDGILGFAGAEAPNAAAVVSQAVEAGQIAEGQIKVTGIGFPSQCRDAIKNGTITQILSWNPQETGKVAVYVLAAMEEGQAVEDLEIDGIELTIDGTNIYHGCIMLDINNIDDYNYS